VILYVALPLVLAFYPSLHALSACVLHHLLSVDLSGNIVRGASAGGCVRPSALYLVDFLAATSAASFLGILTWARIYRTVTCRPLSWSRWTWLAISSRI
jgi:hypothetical protein